MTAIPYANRMLLERSESHETQLETINVGSYVIEMGIGINPVKSTYQVNWTLLGSEKDQLINTVASNPNDKYDLTTSTGNTVKVVIRSISATRIRGATDFWKVSAELHRRHL